MGAQGQPLPERQRAPRQGVLRALGRRLQGCRQGWRLGIARCNKAPTGTRTSENHTRRRSLGITAQEFRTWREKAWFPESPFLRVSHGWQYKSRDQAASFQIYLRDQVEDIVKIAQEEGIYAPDFQSPPSAEFTNKVKALFNEYKKRYGY
ncbi:hypothetical protein GCM10010149_88620 [Nonomuraea roseoviolacea subsp. roseoviolacea]